MNYNHYSHITYEATNEFSTNGDFSVKTISTHEDYRPYIGVNLTDVSKLINKIITFSASVKNNDNVTLKIYKWDDNDDLTSSEVAIPAGAGDYSVSTFIDSNIVRLWLRVDYPKLTAVGTVFYIDNLRLITQ